MGRGASWFNRRESGCEGSTGPRFDERSAEHCQGNGKFSERDRARFFEIARGSALECAACLDVLVVRKLAGESQVAVGKERLVHVVRMLMGLLRRFSGHAGMIREDEGDYEQEQDHEQEQEQEKE